MNNDLYETFGVKNCEELLEKMENNDPTVQSLVDFYNNYESRQINTKHITMPDIYADYIKEKNLVPKKDEIIITSLNTRNQPLKSVKIKEDDNLSKYFNDVYDGTMVQFMTASGSDISKEVLSSKIEELETLSLNNIDNFKFLDNVIYSLRGEYSVGNYEETSINSQIRKISEVKNHSLKELDHYNEFSKYYAHNELIGTDIFDDEKIKNNLKIAYENLSYEEATIIQYDKDYKISNVIDVTAGSANSSMLNIPRMAKLIHDSEQGVLFVHGHPSQSAEFSQSDFDSMEKLSEVIDSFGKNLTESYVVAGDKVIKISEEIYESSVVSFNENEKENYLIHRLGYDKSDNINSNKQTIFNIDKMFIDEKKSYTKIHMTIQNSENKESQDVIYATTKNPVDKIKEWQKNELTYKDLVKDNLLGNIAFRDIDRNINATKIPTDIKEKMGNPDTIIQDYEKEKQAEKEIKNTPSR